MRPNLLYNEKQLRTGYMSVSRNAYTRALANALRSAVLYLIKTLRAESCEHNRTKPQNTDIAKSCRIIRNWFVANYTPVESDDQGTAGGEGRIRRRVQSVIKGRAVSRRHRNQT